MKFAVITHIKHFKKSGEYYSYAPYVREMNLWFQHVDEVLVVGTFSSEKPGAIDLPYKAKNLEFKAVPDFDILGLKSVFKTLRLLPSVLKIIYRTMQEADHIHLRCPGNVGLLGALVQIFFPHKSKTAKYAGNWKPGVKQPRSYRFQKWILSNTFLTKNMQVIVYGDWPKQSANVKAFFTATYTEKDKMEIPRRKYDLPLRFLFVGSLSPGKQPVYALELVAELIEQGFPSELHVYGEGPERKHLNKVAKELNVEHQLFLHGNQPAEAVKEAYKKSHFLMLPSKSEGWPKVVAEAMWWGVIPIATPVSCVLWMLDFGKRGVLLQMDLDSDVKKLQEHLVDKTKLKTMAAEASIWSRNYTLERFNSEIENLL
ncbi:glycosyltransferase involved in cell wall biosynthesis [Leeuwenhoekiella aestuarii]|uniref:Glycosyltransferase involved in cell wall biosynthesis n=1 Tax=Leeuwenhoekiella aestuarii TaxID=2249426 RepID=A0A4Q0NPY8_9FLAO|nr:glycosyltransferase [Leeuwenhoekiella aestuarii]RXG12318.1 glycosyltransferase involved in cell wall biosynthesis [Leeuwenhoekiella aestuarii]RXG13751.1 glycosyltransferase involved in cell wall biosynthesis [Leeuwenhoekiella aestuarii]